MCGCRQPRRGVASSIGQVPLSPGRRARDAVRGRMTRGASMVVHAVWVPAEVGEASELFLWGEAEDEAAWRPALALAASSGPGGSDVRLHPRCAAPSLLRDTLARLGLEGTLVGATSTLLLPTGPTEASAPAGVGPTWADDGSGASGSAGAASPRVIGGSEATGSAGVGPPRARVAVATFGNEVEPLPSAGWPAAGGRPRTTGLRRWRVGGLRIGLGGALPWLAGLAADESTGADGPALAADLRYWARAAAFALDLLRAEQVVPSLDRRPDGDLQAVWRPLLSGQVERRRLRALADAMPLAIRIAAGDEPPPPEERLSDFLRAGVDAL